jgi:hypothetical protein
MVRLTIRTADGRHLIARFDREADAPLIEEGPADLHEAILTAWTGRPKVGRPAGLINIVDAEPLRKAVREMRIDRVKRITKKTVAARSGLTESDIRGFLKATRQTWSEFLASF